MTCLHKFATSPSLPVPPACELIQVALEVDDRGKQRLILRVTADFVRVQASQGWVEAGLGAADEGWPFLHTHL